VGVEGKREKKNQIGGERGEERESDGRGVCKTRAPLTPKDPTAHEKIIP